MQIASLKNALARKEAQSAMKEERSALQSHKTKDPRSPIEKLKLKSERTPPRPRMLSIENSGVVTTELAMNPSDTKRGSKTSVKPKIRTEHTPIRFRRLSLGGPKHENDQVQVKKTDDVCPSQCLDVSSSP